MSTSQERAKLALHGHKHNDDFKKKVIKYQMSDAMMKLQEGQLTCSAQAWSALFLLVDAFETLSYVQQIFLHTAVVCNDIMKTTLDYLNQVLSFSATGDLISWICQRPF